jgi:hypothetical protein
MRVECLASHISCTMLSVKQINWHFTISIYLCLHQNIFIIILVNQTYYKDHFWSQRIHYVEDCASI